MLLTNNSPMILLGSGREKTGRFIRYVFIVNDCYSNSENRSALSYPQLWITLCVTIFYICLNLSIR
jgi:hypothetical protein